MKCNITRRGKHSWRIKYDIGTDHITGKRQTRFLTVRGTKKEAEIEAAKIVAGLSLNSHVEGSRETVAQFAERWLRDWADVSAATAQRYEQLLRLQVCARIGQLPIQKLAPSVLATLYRGLLRDGKGGKGLSARTVGHVHRVLHVMLQRAAQLGVIHGNPASLVKAPKVRAAEIETLSAAQVTTILHKLKDSPIYTIATVALGTGMRRAELLALRWKDINVDGAMLSVRRSLEETHKYGLVFKSPKTRNGTRSISLPASTVTTLRAHWRAQQEQRLALGQGKAPDDALVFGNWDGSARSPNALTDDWRRAMQTIGVTATFHSLRHTHASTLIASGMDVLTISRRLGHASAAVTLVAYGHLFQPDDKAALVMEAALRGLD